MKKFLPVIFLLSLLSCDRPASFSEKLQLYAETFNQPAKMDGIKDSAGIKTISYSIQFDRPIKRGEEVYLGPLSMLRGLIIQECLLPIQKETYSRVFFNYEFKGDTILEDFKFFRTPSPSQLSVPEKADKFFSSIEYTCHTYLGEKNPRKIHFLVQNYDSISNDELRIKAKKRAQFVRFCVLADSAKKFDWMFFHHAKIGERPKVPLAFTYRVNDPALFKL